MTGPAHFDESVLLYVGVVLFKMLACEECGFCNWVILGALGLSGAYFLFDILLVLDACNGRGAYFLT